MIKRPGGSRFGDVTQRKQQCGRMILFDCGIKIGNRFLFGSGQLFVQTICPVN